MATFSLKSNFFQVTLGCEKNTLIKNKFMGSFILRRQHYIAFTPMCYTSVRFLEVSYHPRSRISSSATGFN